MYSLLNVDQCALFSNRYYAVPGPPQNVHVLDNTTVVFWQAPQEPNGNITGYEVRISTTSRQTIRVIPGSRVLYYGIRRSDVPMTLAWHRLRLETSNENYVRSY